MVERLVEPPLDVKEWGGLAEEQVEKGHGGEDSGEAKDPLEADGELRGWARTVSLSCFIEWQELIRTSGSTLYQVMIFSSITCSRRRQRM